jgi:AcrR family transcriptional regulator
LANLSGALIELLLERGWESIGVGELCARADVARSTFYLHFANKEELLESGFASLRGTIRLAAPSASLRQTGRFGFADGLADHIFGNRRTFLAFVGGNGGGIVRERFRALLGVMIAEELAACRIIDPALVQFLSGGFVSLAAHLMATGSSGPRAFSERFHALAAPLVTVA